MSFHFIVTRDLYNLDREIQSQDANPSKVLDAKCGAKLDGECPLTNLKVRIVLSLLCHSPRCSIRPGATSMVPGGSLVDWP